eukprot:CAMPEP_0184678368 /NCGR_PEP_ID=MMETSP0312-20130426/1106_1 /TAXON_ID=31354 /ORGANISM="Compsopogon coeruleus, Strain SAG 36.94" /LENGTH=291 /DNA_ID=CAMNT_0027127057 /DNA_START=118 /DNA_END=990 /DNA_ORIENTATION=+
MAKLGEGDARWIVSERDDGRNVNHWHWAERDVTGWAKGRLTALLRGLEVRSADGTARCWTTEVESLEGDATLYNRKGTLKTIHDFRVTVKWLGQVDGTADEIKGTAQFDLYDDSPEVVFHCEDFSDAALKCKGLWKDAGQAVFGSPSATFVRELTAGADLAEGMEVTAPSATTSAGINKQPQSDSADVCVSKPPDSVVSNIEEKPTTTSLQQQDTSKPTGVVTRDIAIVDEFYASPMDLYQALMDPQRVSGYTQRSAQISDKVGGSFSIRDGRITGTNIALSPGEKIVQKW